MSGHEVTKVRLDHAAAGLGNGRWEHFPHAADMGIRGLGRSKAEAFAQAALALVAVVADPFVIRPNETVAIDCRAPNDEFLLVEWLNAVVYEMATRRMLFKAFTVEFTAEGLRGRAQGERVDVTRHQPVVEVKGATMAELKVECGEDGQWIAQCIVYI